MAYTKTESDTRGDILDTYIVRMHGIVAHVNANFVSVYIYIYIYKYIYIHSYGNIVLAISESQKALVVCERHMI